MTGDAFPLRCGARALLMTLACAASAAWADPVAQMRQCRLLTDVSLKAACYDAIVLPAPTGSADAAAPAVPAATPAGAVAAAAGLTAAREFPSPASAATAAATSFGLPAPAPAPVQAGAVVAGALESSISGLFEGWQAQSRIRLANGQIWQVTDGSEGVYARRDPKVRISRGTLGSFFMQIEGISQTPRVRRIE